MKVIVLGATGRTGRLVVDEVTRRGHDVVAVVRDPAAAGLAPHVATVAGDARDAGVLDAAIAGADVVVSALGPRRGDRSLHADVAPLVLAAMTRHGVDRFVGVSGAGLTIPGDRKRLRDRLISSVIARTAPVRDKAVEHTVWAGSDVRWTLVRPPRFVDRPATGRIEHAAHTSPAPTSITRADLAAFVAQLAENGGYEREAPLVANARRPRRSPRRRRPARRVTT